MKFHSLFINNWKWRFLLIFIMLINFLNFSSALQSLYKEGDDVLELDIDNFNKSVYEKPTAFFVEFYSSWCGHCINYAPTYIKFAKLMKSWNNVVIVAALNCVDEKNSPICREHDISAFPMLKYFKAYSKSKADSINFESNKNDFFSMSSEIVKHIKNDFDEKRPITWPKFQATLNSETSLTDLLASTKASQALFYCIVVEKEPFSNGYALIANYAGNNKINIFVVEPTHPIALKYSNVKIPSFHIFYRNNSETSVFSSNSEIDWIGMKTHIDKILLKDLSLKTTLPSVFEKESVIDSPVNWNQFEVQLLDLQTAMLYMLTQEIPRNSIIKEKKLSALRNWIHLLKRFGPGSTPIRRFFYRLDDWLIKRVSETSILADDWLATIEKLQEELGHPLTPNKNYLACRGSKPNFRGYTCGLWTLFHVITVQAYKEEKQNANFKPYEDVFEPIYQFIVQFLSCDICARNFDKMQNEYKLNRVNKAEDVVLWLWRAHNVVNKRLSGDKSEDPKFLKQQFPPASICFDCRQSSGEFNEQATFNFLLSYYSDIKVDGLTLQPNYKLKEFANGKLEKVASKHFNPKFMAISGKVDNLEELEARIKAQETQDSGPKREWKSIGSNRIVVNSSTDRKLFYLIWIVIVGLCLGFALVKYRQNRSKFWKAFHYYDYKLLPWNNFTKSSDNNFKKYAA